MSTEPTPPGGWSTAGARLPVPPPAQQGWVLRLVNRSARRFFRTQVPDIFAVLHINPRLFWPWLLFASRLMPGGRLPARERELVILRTGWNCRSRYEWGQHVEIGLRCGLSDAQIVAVTRGPEAFVEPRTRTLIEACDELCRTNVVSDAVWRALQAHFSERLLIEIVMLVGHYRMVAGFLNSAGLALEPQIEAVLQQWVARTADASRA